MSGAPTASAISRVFNNRGIMAMTQHERAAIAVLAVLFVAAAVLYAAWHVLEAKAAHLVDEQRSQANVTVRQGETLVIDTKEDEAGVPGDSAYRAGFCFDGVMEITLEDVRVEHDLSAGPGRFFRNEPCDGYVVVEVALKNVDAISWDTSHPCRFNVTGVFKSSPENGFPSDPVYFSGTPSDAGEKEGYVFDLAEGESRTLTMAFAVSAESLPQDGCLAFHAGMGLPMKYRFVSDLAVGDAVDLLMVEGGDNA